MKLQTTIELPAPKGTKVITNEEFITLARKSNGNILLFTCRTADINSFDLFDESNWNEFTRGELKQICEL